MHLAMDTATSDIRAVGFTPSSDGDIEQANAIGSREPARVLPELLDQIPEGEEIGTVTARRSLRYPPLPLRHRRPPGHCDHPDPQERPTLERRLSGSARHGPRTSGGPSLAPKRNPARHPALRQGVLETLDRIPRKKPDQSQDALAGSLEPVALDLLDLKAFGDRISARDPDRQTAEIQIRIALMNRFSALGTAEIIRVA